MTTEYNPLVSILMNCYNGEAFVAEAINSVLKQTYQNYEVVFWDNASTDQTEEIVKKFSDPRIKYFKGIKNVPLYHARNFALEKCQGELIAFLDIDDLWREDKLEKQVPLFKNEKIGLVFSDTYFLKDGNIIHRYFKDKKPHRGKCFKELLTNYFLSLETVVIRKKCFNDWNYAFDERFSHIGDLELFVRISYYWEIDYINEPLGTWRVHSNSLSFKSQEKFYKETELMIDKYKEVIPNFNIDHANELYELKKQIAIWKAKFHILKDERINSLKIIYPYALTQKGSILFIMSLMPLSLGKFILNKRSLA